MKRIHIVLVVGIVLLITILMLVYAQLQAMSAIKASNSPVARWSLALADAVGHWSAGHMLASIRLFALDDPHQQELGFRRLEAEYEDGSAYAAGKLGWAYQRGLVVEPDLERAIELYEEAARSGMTYWQFLLAHAHEQGYLGFTPSEEQALYWLNMQPKTHIAKYECWVANYYRDGIFPRNDEQLARHEALCEAAD